VLGSFVAGDDAALCESDDGRFTGGASALVTPGLVVVIGVVVRKRLPPRRCKLSETRGAFPFGCGVLVPDSSDNGKQSSCLLDQACDRSSCKQETDKPVSSAETHCAAPHNRGNVHRRLSSAFGLKTGPCVFGAF